MNKILDDLFKILLRSRSPVTTVLGWSAGLIIANQITFADAITWITIRATDPEAAWSFFWGIIAAITGTLCYREEIITLTDNVDKETPNGL